MTEQLDLFHAAQSTSAPTRLRDAADRARVIEDLDATLFVEAGAGSGKTSSLVGRVANLVLSGVPIGSIAAITFTEKAASELRHRVRGRLADLAAGAQRSDDEVALATCALTELDQAPLGTLHAFARRILSEFPIEAQLPPRFDVLDEVQSATAFHERFSDFLETLLDNDDSIRLVEMCEHDKFGIDKGVRRMAEDFQANWDLVDDRVSGDMPARFDEVAAQRAIADACQHVATFAAPAGDTQEPVIAAYRHLGQQLSRSLPLGELLRLFHAAVDVRRAGQGNTANWTRHHGDPSVVDDYRTAIARVRTLVDEAFEGLNLERRLTLGALLREFTLQSVRDRSQAGELEFHDLLVLARQLVANNAHVRRQVHERYTRVLLDEFQDTDPIQLELAVRITADPAQQHADWRELHPLPGRLTVVGDPKQSIYRFRRADISQFLRAAEQIGADRATLSANFRSAAPIIDWVNTTMRELIVFEHDVQPAYEPLEAARRGGDRHGSVTVLGAQPHTDLTRVAAEALREREASDVAAVVVQALNEGWSVLRDGALQPCRPGDIAILLPSRLSLVALSAALSARDVPFRAENSSLVYAAAEIRALMLALRAADDPTDELAIVAALRTSLFGCSDRHLYEWHVTHGQPWSWRQLPGDLVDHPVAVALHCFGELATRMRHDTPSQLLAWLVRERCVMELALARRDYRDVWRRIRFVIDQARAWSEAGGHGVRRYLLWTRLQGEEGRFVTETVLPETDHDAVRIMTVHAAKGLEFPITIVSGLTGKPNRSHGRRVVWPEGTWALSDRSDPTYQQFQPIDEQMSDAERLRLLYVACTRAMDHLVVSLHRSERPDHTAAKVLAHAAHGAPHREFDGYTEPLIASPLPARELDWGDEDQWWQQWQLDLAAASSPAALSATALASAGHTYSTTSDAGVRKDPIDLDLPPWQRGRYGTAVGRAVHAVLQFADLRSGANLAPLAAAQAAAEGVPDYAGTIESLARSAMAAPIVANGIATEHWRELFVAADIGGTVVEGYIDLLVRDPERGLLVVDYKTDQIPHGPEREQRLARYGTQLAAYGLALEKVLAEPIMGGVLVICRPNGAAEQVAIADWSTRTDELRRALAAGS